MRDPATPSGCKLCPRPWGRTTRSIPSTSTSADVTSTSPASGRLHLSSRRAVATSQDPPLFLSSLPDTDTYRTLDCSGRNRLLGIATSRRVSACAGQWSPVSTVQCEQVASFPSTVESPRRSSPPTFGREPPSLEPERLRLPSPWEPSHSWGWDRVG